MNYYNQEKMTVALTGSDLLFEREEWWAEYGGGRPYLNIPISCYFDVESVLGVDIRGDNDTVLEMSLLIYMDTREVSIVMWLDGSEYMSPEYILFELAEGSAESIIQAAEKAAKEIFNMSLDAVNTMNRAETEEIVLLLEDVVMSVHIRDNGDGWDHTIYDLNGVELDGGIYSDSDSILGNAFAEFRSWYECTKDKLACVLPLVPDKLMELREDGQLKSYVEPVIVKNKYATYFPE